MALFLRLISSQFLGSCSEVFILGSYSYYCYGLIPATPLEAEVAEKRARKAELERRLQEMRAFAIRNGLDPEDCIKRGKELHQQEQEQERQQN